MNTQPNRLISGSAVSDRTSLSRTTLWRKVKAGEFPAPVRLTTHRVAWREDEVAGWIAGCISEKGAR